MRTDLIWKWRLPPNTTCRPNGLRSATAATTFWNWPRMHSCSRDSRLSMPNTLSRCIHWPRKQSVAARLSCLPKISVTTWPRWRRRLPTIPDWFLSPIRIIRPAPSFLQQRSKRSWKSFLRMSSLCWIKRTTNTWCPSCNTNRSHGSGNIRICWCRARCPRLTVWQVCVSVSALRNRRLPICWIVFVSRLT